MPGCQEGLEFFSLGVYTGEAAGLGKVKQPSQFSQIKGYASRSKLFSWEREEKRSEGCLDVIAGATF